ncbi:hypothetical protein [Ruegeria arenilitoris]|uniref:hypothetical protein n=1 Tax=Ruegeria arenilitoris TaxID=1173585 RepID=UPI00147C36ED|nr:hypothetical protein [Ruegeria arenilitoris]
MTTDEIAFAVKRLIDCASLPAKAPRSKDVELVLKELQGRHDFLFNSVVEITTLLDSFDLDDDLIKEEIEEDIVDDTDRLGYIDRSINRFFEDPIGAGEDISRAVVFYQLTDRLGRAANVVTFHGGAISWEFSEEFFGVFRSTDEVKSALIEQGFATEAHDISDQTRYEFLHNARQA